MLVSGADAAKMKEQPKKAGDKPRVLKGLDEHNKPKSKAAKPKAKPKSKVALEPKGSKKGGKSDDGSPKLAKITSMFGKSEAKAAGGAGGAAAADRVEIALDDD